MNHMNVRKFGVAVSQCHSVKGGWGGSSNVRARRYGIDFNGPVMLRFMLP